MYCLHSSLWWQSHWKKTGIVDVEIADSMPEGWQQLWLQRQAVVAPTNLVEIRAVESDAGNYLGYVRSLVAGGRMPNWMRLFSHYLQRTLPTACEIGLSKNAAAQAFLVSLIESSHARTCQLMVKHQIHSTVAAEHSK